MQRFISRNLTTRKVAYWIINPPKLDSRNLSTKNAYKHHPNLTDDISIWIFYCLPPIQGENQMNALWRGRPVSGTVEPHAKEHADVHHVPRSFGCLGFSHIGVWYVSLICLILFDIVWYCLICLILFDMFAIVWYWFISFNFISSTFIIFHNHRPVFDHQSFSLWWIHHCRCRHQSNSLRICIQI